MFLNTNTSSTRHTLLTWMENNKQIGDDLSSLVWFVLILLFSLVDFVWAGGGGRGRDGKGFEWVEDLGYCFLEIKAGRYLIDINWVSIH